MSMQPHPRYHFGNVATSFNAAYGEETSPPYLHGVDSARQSRGLSFWWKPFEKCFKQRSDSVSKLLSPGLHGLRHGEVDRLTDLPLQVLSRGPGLHPVGFFGM